MKFFLVLAAAIAATVSAQTCDTTKLLPLLQDPNLKACTADSGLTLPPVGEISKDTLVKACASKGCQGLLATVLSLNLGDCSVGSFKLETNLITPLKSACAGSSGAAANSTAAANATTTAPAATEAAKAAGSMAGSMAGMDMEAETAAPSSGSTTSDKATTTGPAASVPTPAPSKSSAASAVSVAAGAAVAAVAASLW